MTSGKHQGQVTYHLRVGIQRKLVRLISGKHREQITYTLRMWKQGNFWSADLREEASETNHVHAEDVKIRTGQADFREASRKNDVHADDAKTVRLAPRKHREQITHTLRDAKTMKTGQAGFKNASTTNHIHSENAEKGKPVRLTFTEASRTNH